MLHKRGKEAIEESYDIILSNKGPYYMQLGFLDQSGEIANTKHLADILFKMCEALDLQEVTIDSLERELNILKSKSLDETNTQSTQSVPDTGIQS